MNETGADKIGAASLQPELRRIAAISSREQLIDEVARLHLIGVPALFEFSAQPDLHDATKAVAAVAQGSLGLPDRDYYLNQNDNAKQTRSRYLTHVSKMFVLAGDDSGIAETEAASVLQTETSLAEASFDRVKMRDPKNRSEEHTSELQSPCN